MIESVGQLGFLAGDLDARVATTSAGAEESFVSALQRTHLIANSIVDEGGTAQNDRIEKARDAARKLVASTFIIPMLQMSRESVLQGGPFAPGMGEKRFGPLLDQHIADSVVQGMDMGLIDTIVQRFAGTARATAEAHEQIQQTTQELQDA